MPGFMLRRGHNPVLISGVHGAAGGGGGGGQAAGDDDADGQGLVSLVGGLLGAPLAAARRHLNRCMWTRVRPRAIDGGNARAQLVAFVAQRACLARRVRYAPCFDCLTARPPLHRSLCAPLPAARSSLLAARSTRRCSRSSSWP